MRVRVKEPVPEDHRHPGPGDPVGEVAALCLAQPEQVEVCELRSLEQLERQHAPARVRPIHTWDLDLRHAGEVAAKGLGIPGLGPVVELAADRARELVDDLLGIDEIERPNALLGKARRLEEE